MPTWSEFLSTQPQQSHLGAGCSLTGLDHLGIIRVSGADARSFLQGQLSSDIQQLDAEHTQLSGYCNPKGRLLAIFRVVPDQDAILLIVPQTLLPTILRRLQLYVLRADVQLHDASQTLALLECAGPGAEQVLPDAPIAEQGVLHIEDKHILRLPGDRLRLQVIGPVAALQRLWQQAVTKAVPSTQRAWHLLDIRAGLPMISAATSEAFVPQMVNLHLVGGVSFQKGCYTGQEVVARMQYLGKLKRRMYRVHIAADTEIPVGQALYDTANPTQAVGTILQIAPTDSAEGDYEALAVCQIRSMQTPNLSLYADATNGSEIQCLGLSYADW